MTHTLGGETARHCPRCNGTGIDETGVDVCEECEGTGRDNDNEVELEC